MTIAIWAAFIVLIICMLAVDLHVIGRRGQLQTKEALYWTCFSMSVAVSFTGAIYWLYEYDLIEEHIGAGSGLSGSQAALQYFTAWLIEQSLSLDNVFVFALVFNFFQVPPKYQRRVLFWGVLGALILRGLMIALGAALISTFSWTQYLFGGLLVYAAIKMLYFKEEKFDPNNNVLFTLARRVYPMSDEFDREKFFTRLENGTRAMTPLFPVLLVIESTDVLFAVDSIPAVFAITKDPFLVFTSNIFAILALRSLYFVLAALLHKFKKLKTSLVLVLLFVGGKMLLEEVLHVPTAISLGVIVFLLLMGVLPTLLAREKND